jgi:hypothetical protein
MDKAYTIEADRKGSSFGLVNFYHLIEVSKGVALILEGPMADVGGGVLGKAAAHTVLLCPLVDRQVKFGSRSLGFLL